jgi:large conductance mechanosensitive channel
MPVVDPEDQELKKKPKHHHHLELEPDELVREQVGGFVHFLRDYAVVGLAVGFIIGVQAQTVIKQLIESFITPLINVLVGENFQNKSLTISSGENTSKLAYGKFLYVLLNFVIVMLFIYLLVKLFKLDKLNKKPEPKKK